MRHLIFALAVAACFIAPSSAAAVDGTVLVSLNAAGAVMPGGSGSTSSAPSVTANGEGVAFESLSRAVPVDVNETSDVFFRVMPREGEEGEETEGETTLMSVALDGASGNNRSYSPSVSGDGRFVVFESLASNLVEGDGNGMADVFLRARNEQTTVRLTAADGGDPNGPSAAPVISADGAFVAFCSAASNLAADDDGISNAFLIELATGAITRVGPQEAAASGGGCVRVALSADGAFMAFSYRVQDGDGVSAAVFRYSRVGNESARIAGGGSGANGLGISGDGSVVAFDSLAGDLVDGDGNGVPDAFTWEAASDEIQRISVGPSGSEGVRDSGNVGIAVSGDGRFVAYSSSASNIAPGDGNGASDVRPDVAQYRIGKIVAPVAGRRGNDHDLVATLDKLLCNMRHVQLEPADMRQDVEEVPVVSAPQQARRWRRELEHFYDASVRAKARTWPVLLMEGDHNPHWRQPEALAELLAGMR